MKLARAKKTEPAKNDTSEELTKSSDGIAEVVPDKGVTSASSETVDGKTPAVIPDASSAETASTATEPPQLPPLAPVKRPPIRRIDDNGEFIRACSECGMTILGEERNLSWETMDFCNEICLGNLML